MKNTVKGIHNTYILKGKYKPLHQDHLHTLQFLKRLICFGVFFACMQHLRRSEEGFGFPGAGVIDRWF